MSNISNFTSDLDVGIVKPPLPPWVFQLTSCYLCLVLVFGVICNTGMLVVYYKVKQLRNNFHHLLISLLVGELLTAITGIPVELLAAARGGWDFGEGTCIAMGFGMTFLSMASIN